VKYITSVLPYATLMTAMVGVISFIFSVRISQRTRYLTAAVELVQTLKSADFTESIHLVMTLPENASPQSVLSSEELTRAANTVCHTFESLGIMVFHRLLPLYLVDQLVGGYGRAAWRRLQPYVRMRREVHGPTFAEWFQWLSERLATEPVPESKLGAAIAYRHWRA
jgi:hypothetical protein